MKGKIVKIEADWVLPVTSPPVKDCAIIVVDDVITNVGEKRYLSKFPCDEIIDCSGKILLPGLINAHAHLELTGFKGKIKRGLSFTDWAREVVSMRNSYNENEIISSIKNGLDELISSGVTAIGDFSQTGITARIFKEKGLKGTVFLEFAGFNPELKDQRMKVLKEKIPQSPPLVKGGGGDYVRFGIAPHSPYSVSRDLLKESYKFAKNKGFPIAIHISEIPEEVEFIKGGSGAMRGLLTEFGVWDDDWKIPYSTPVCYLEGLGILKGTTGIHLNIVTDEDIRILKENDVSVVYCPGSNRWFGRNWKYPLREFLNNDINVAFGTDSLASNECLNMFYEMRIVKENFPDIDNNTILRMATINGAKAIGFEDVTGGIAVGRKADIIGVDVKESSITDPVEYVINMAERVSFAMAAGKIIKDR
ncbi:MAG: amidohydrolase family protein [Nitrospinae bacterium]|nr:amidohydrolase family protein [Nitrospinota bacterium]